MIDLHSHVLPGVDDGPPSLAGSLEILYAAAADGVGRIAATPHVRDDYPTAPETMERLVDEVNAAARAERIPVEVLRGGELDLAVASAADDATLRRFGLGGNPRVLLLEFPYAGWPLELRDLVFRLAARGFSVVLAHPERNADVQEAPERLRALVDAGVLVQLTAASVDGRLGRRPKEAALRLLDARLAHMLASDAHAAHVRAAGLTAARESLGDVRLGRWLTQIVPAAVVADSPLPRRPAPRPGRMRFPWRR